MDSLLDTLIVMTDAVAMPITIGVVVFLFLFFVVRPYLNLLAKKKKTDALAAVEKARRKRELHDYPEILPEQDKSEKSEQSIRMDEQPHPNPSAMAAQEKISKLAESNPERAGDLVKEWLKNDD